MIVTIMVLALYTSLLENAVAFRTCIPRTQFVYNEKLCYCDAKGRWSDKNCINGSRRRTCMPGKVVRQSCYECTCDSKGEFLCRNIFCVDHLSSVRKQLSAIGNRCLPLKHYKVNCTNCLCPASGQTSDALCTVDASCLVNSQSQLRHHVIAAEATCMPNIMYIFPCLQCQCSDDGKFLLKNCFEICQPPILLQLNQQCKPGSFYRKDCNYCQCSNQGIKNDKLCTHASCDVNSKNSYLVSLKNIRKICTPYTFTRPICLFCDCTSNRTINEDSCIVTNCSTNLELKSANFTGKCNTNEIVPVCVECFCLLNGSTNGQYCSRECNYQSKFKLLERILAENMQTKNLIQKSDLKVMALKNSCKPNTIYLYEGKYCICGSTASSFKLCKLLNDTKPFQTSGNQIHYNVNIPCKPQTFVEFDCNTCYCSKKGKIDPKWCTYDDCNLKRSVQESHKQLNQLTLTSISDVCTPGSISVEKCNFCICPESGLSNEKACTKNFCSEAEMSRSNVKFTCEPLAYYEVDCNVCYCPSDGLKNVAKCTKNSCKKKILRSDACIPGQLFSEVCNICLCPPNGNTDYKICTNHMCHPIKTWDNFDITNNLLEDRIESENVGLCFPGEQFTIGCKNCVCPDMGLKMYAECDASQCNENDEFSTGTELQNMELSNEKPHVRVRRKFVIESDEIPCIKYNVTENQKRCTPGTTYIVRCQLCICPYMGHIIYFCRPLNRNFYCEQPFPNVNYSPMGRRETLEENIKYSNNKSELIKAASMHNHTKYACDKIGQIMDNCFVCECEENHVLFEEHCFRRQDEYCANAKPTFLVNSKVILD